MRGPGGRHSRNLHDHASEKARIAFKTGDRSIYLQTFNARILLSSFLVVGFKRESSFEGRA